MYNDRIVGNQVLVKLIAHKARPMSSIPAHPTKSSGQILGYAIHNKEVNTLTLGQLAGVSVILQ